jgi:hypothetical protein
MDNIYEIVLPAFVGGIAAVKAENSWLKIPLRNVFAAVAFGLFRSASAAEDAFHAAARIEGPTSGTNYRATNAIILTAIGEEAPAYGVGAGLYSGAKVRGIRISFFYPLRSPAFCVLCGYILELAAPCGLRLEHQGNFFGCVGDVGHGWQLARLVMALIVTLAGEWKKGIPKEIGRHKCC